MLYKEAKCPNPTTVTYCPERRKFRILKIQDGGGICTVRNVVEGDAIIYYSCRRETIATIHLFYGISYDQF